MKYKTVMGIVASLFLFCSISTADDHVKQIQGSPKAFVQEPQYNFVNAVEGTVLEHSFIIQNKGTAELNILKVGTG
ncbi:MAG TPA: hypothetical protein PLQ82_16345 [Desulfobacteraceae bacterium]|nr:hypothetical protein [Desulfobacteraceae bacterium]HPQ30042.1 hypothetical protein [Desulfobacteraceae bacterium]